MTMNEYQQMAMRTSRRDISPDDHFFNAMLGLARRANDVLWYIAEAASAMGWELDVIAAHNVEKLRMRYPDGFNTDDSLNRGDNT